MRDELPDIAVACRPLIPVSSHLMVACPGCSVWASLDGGFSSEQLPELFSLAQWLLLSLTVVLPLLLLLSWGLCQQDAAFKDRREMMTVMDDEGVLYVAGGWWPGPGPEQTFNGPQRAAAALPPSPLPA